MSLDLGTIVGRIKIDGADTADRQIDAVQTSLRVLGRSATTDLRVTADVQAATRNLDRTQGTLRTLQGARAEMQVTADTSGAERSLDGIAAHGERAGAEAGEATGESMVGGMASRLGVLSEKSGPIVGSILGAVAVVASVHPMLKIVDAIMSDAARVRQGMFSARTGLDAATAARYGRAAGAAYTQNFGESVDENLDAATSAMQSGLLGGKSTQREIQDTIQGLDTVSSILGAEVPEVARAAGQAIKTGLAKDTTDALGLIVRAQQEGLDVSGDLLDTITEYGTQFRKIGLDGPTAFGLVAQAVRNGARDTDLAADAIKEFSIRSIDGSTTTIAAYKSLGLNAQTMMERMAKGGPTAQKAMQTVFDSIRRLKDPVTRSQVAVELFGTQAEDLGAALNGFDLSKARKEFGDTADVLGTAIDQINDNAAAKVEQGKRSIEQAATGVENALASAFSPDLGKLADWVSSHSADIVDFVADVGDGFFDAAEAGVHFGASTLAVFASVTSGLGDLLDGVYGFTSKMLRTAQLAAAATGNIPLAALLDKAGDGLDKTHAKAAAFFDDASKGATAAADALNDKVLPALKDAQRAYDDSTASAKDQAAVADATAATAKAIADLGSKTDGTAKSGAALDKAAKRVHDSLIAQELAAQKAGESNKDLKARAQDTHDAFVEQAEAAGLTAKQAEALAKKYGLIPKDVTTEVKAKNTAAAKASIDTVHDAAAALRDKTIKIDADTSAASAKIAGLMRALALANIAVVTAGAGAAQKKAGGGKIVGAGGPTDDAVLIAASNGEFVVNARSYARHKDLVDAINADALPHLASGGAVASAKKSKTAAYAAWKSHKKATNADDYRERYEDARDRYNDLVASQRDVKTQARRGDYTSSVTSGIDGAYGAIDDVIAASHDASLTKGQRSSLAKVAAQAEPALKSLYKQADGIQSKLDAASDHLEKMKELASAASDTVKGSFDLSAAKTTSPYGYDGTYTKGGVLSTARRQASLAKSFGSKLTSLVKKLGSGAAASAIAQQALSIFGSSPADGVAFEDALLSMSTKELGELKSDYSTIASAGAAAGQAASAADTAGGLTKAQQSADALSASLDKVNAQIAGWGTTLTNAMLKPYGLKLDKSGNVVKRARGGFVFGAGSSTSDSIDARLSSGEFVVNAAAAARNAPALVAMNAGGTPTASVDPGEIAAMVATAVRDGLAQMGIVVKANISPTKRDAAELWVTGATEAKRAGAPTARGLG